MGLKSVTLGCISGPISGLSLRFPLLSIISTFSLSFLFFERSFPLGETTLVFSLV